MKLLAYSLTTLFFFFTLTNSDAQTYVLAQDSAININVTGTSTLHSWTVTAKEVKDVPASLTLSGADKNTIQDFSFGVVVEKMDGGRGASMNKKVMTALKGAEHPVIQFTQTEPVTLQPSGDKGQINLAAKGQLAIAGMDLPVTIQVTGQQQADALILKGSYPLKFSALNIEPPSAMFGSIVCGDDIAVNFEFRYVAE